MRLVLFGAPGSGKGTQGPFIGERYGIPVVSTGEILRDNVQRGSDLGIVAQGYMDAGELVPDDVIINLIRERLTEADAIPGFVLDGFPRTIPQAEALDRMLQQLHAPLDHVIYLRVSEPVLIERLSDRWTCPVCGRVYSKAVSPARAGTCDDDGAKLIQRDDDKPATVRRRIKVYMKESMPVLKRYSNRGLVLEVDADQSVETIRDEIFVGLGERPLNPFEPPRLEPTALVEVEPA
jgi:adenylate kinase